MGLSKPAGKYGDRMTSPDGWPDIDEAAFLNRLKLCHHMFIQFLKIFFPFPNHFSLHLPKKTGRFGQIQSNLFHTIAHIAQAEGFLTDLIYSAKLFIESRHFLTSESIQGNLLIHHAGGALTLMGFQEQLVKK